MGMFAAPRLSVGLTRQAARRVAHELDKRSRIQTGSDLVERLWWIWWGSWRRDPFFGAALCLFAIGSGLYAFSYGTIRDDIQQEFLNSGSGIGWWMADPTDPTFRPAALYLASHVVVILVFIALVARSKCRVAAITWPWAIAGNMAIIWLLSLDAGAHLVPGGYPVWPSTLAATAFVDYQWLVIKYGHRIRGKATRSALRRLLLFGVAASGFMASIQLANSYSTYRISGSTFWTYALAGVIDFTACVLLAAHSIQIFRRGTGTSWTGRDGKGPPSAPTVPLGTQPDVELGHEIEGGETTPTASGSAWELSNLPEPAYSVAGARDC